MVSAMDIVVKTCRCRSRMCAYMRIRGWYEACQN